MSVRVCYLAKLANVRKLVAPFGRKGSPYGKASEPDWAGRRSIKLSKCRKAETAYSPVHTKCTVMFLLQLSEKLVLFSLL